MKMNDNDCKFCIAIGFDLEKDIEIAIIGIIDEVYQSINSTETITDLKKSDSIDVICRKYGSLLFDFDHKYINFNDINIWLQKAQNKGKEIIGRYIDEYKDNVLVLYILQYLECYYRTTVPDYDQILYCLMPFTTNISRTEKLIESFKNNRKNYYNVYPQAFTFYDEDGINNTNSHYWSTRSGDMGFIVVGLNLLQIIKAYILDCGKNHKYLKRCKSCGNMMLGNIHNIAEYCGDECRNAAKKQNVANFRDKLENDIYEAAYHKTYRRYSYYKNKYKKSELSETQMQPFIEAFERLQNEMVDWRKTIASNTVDDEAFFNWLNGQQAVIDGICDKLNIIIGGESNEK